MQHVKHYNEIRVNYDRLIKKMISYANATEDHKTIVVSSPTPFIRVKESRISIRPHSNGMIRLRMYFDRTLAASQIGELHIADGGEVERLIFQFQLE
jgi:hypothetical protein